MSRHTTLTRLPLIIACLAVFLGGIFFLDRADAQARDTIRKHHLEDVERSLYFARQLHGTYPPYGITEWCGVLTDAAVKSEVEAALRAQNEKYGNAEKPFPIDPDDNAPQYFYWKRSPALFELYAILEAAPTSERSTVKCPGAAATLYDYGIASGLREERSSTQP